MSFQHQRHKPPSALKRDRELVVACPPFRSNVNLSRMIRMAGCCGVQRMIACGRPKIDREIARDSSNVVKLEVHRTLPPVLRSLADESYRLVGLEQTTGAENLHRYKFNRRSVIVVGNERIGLSEELLEIMDDVVEIPVYGRPFSYNAATAAVIAMYEYCRQFPDG